MIAMIKHKASDEDILTGEFFGCIRYISFQKVMKEILVNTVYPLETRRLLRNIEDTIWANKVNFWDRLKNHGRTVELDVRIDFDKYILGIEVKNQSGLSSNDNKQNNLNSEMSNNQLSKEARLLRKLSEESISKQPVLLLLARERCVKDIYEESKNKIDNEVAFGYFSWEDVRRQLSQINVSGKYEKAIVDDLECLLDYFGLKCFDDYEIENSEVISLKKVWKYKEY